MASRAPQTLAVAFPKHKPHALNGSLELAVASILGGNLTRPERVSNLLSIVFNQISGKRADLSRVRRLASGAREWLLQRAAGLFWSDTGWFQARCVACDAAFDIPTRLAQAPRKPAGRDFPLVAVRTSLGKRQFEAPNGLHEELLARRAQDEPTRALLEYCGLSERAAQDAREFSDQDIAVIEAALEAASPEIADEVLTHCPNCRQETVARLDPLDFAFPSIQSLLREVHVIAAAYRWSEDAILKLPTSRRRRYASLILADHHSAGGMR